MFRTIYFQTGQTFDHASLPQAMADFMLRYENCAIEQIDGRHLCWETPSDRANDDGTRAVAEIREIKAN